MIVSLECDLRSQPEFFGSKLKTLHVRARRQHGRVKAFAAALVSTALIASTLIAASGPAIPASAAGAAAGAVSGTVFQNFKSSGWKEPASAGVAGALPVAGVTATAYDAQGDIVGSGVSAGDGSYTINVVAAFSDDLRVEFSGWSAPLEPAYAAQGTAPTPLPAAHDTSVQFITLNASHAATGVDFGLIEPEQVTQSNAPIATAVQSAGALTGNSAALPAIVAQPWLLEGEDPVSTNAISKVAPFKKIGSVWGMAYARQSNDLLVAATLKRMSDLGPLGLGGIYRTRDILSPNGSVNANAATAGWFTFSGLPVSNAGGAPLDIGESLVPKDRKLAQSSDPRREIPAFALAGRVGIGSLATSPDGTRLFGTNLYDGHVYAVDISNPQVIPTSAYRIDTPVSASQAIWAVEVHGGQLYIGYVDTGDKPAGGADPGKSAASKGMKAYVASTPIAGVLDASGSAPAWKTELTIDLGYAKGSNIQNWTAESGKKFEVEFPQVKRWNSWTDTWAWTGGTVAMKGPTAANNLHNYPQAILSSIAFDVDGYLNLGFLDRTSVQSGNRSFGAVTTATDLWSTISNGDVLVAAPAAQWEAAGPGCPATAPSESYVLECKGKVGDRAVRTTATVPDGQKPTFDDNEGPGGGEFFNDRRDLGTEKSAGAQNHNEIALGSVTSYPGSRDVATTAMDPRSQAYNTGIMWFDERSGAASRGIDLVPSGGAGTGKTSFQKSGGLGGVALLAVSAPVEIGNRVWLDADLNGRQDADEPAINGAVVELWTTDAGGKPADRIATRTTATVDGQPGTYYFRTDDPDVVAGTNAHPFVANASYVLVFPSGSGAVSLAGPNAGNPGFAGLAWSDLQRTTAQVRVAPTARNAGTTGLNDSNPDVTTGRAAVTVGGPGKNDHSYDSGWYASNGYELAKAFNPGNASIPAGTSYDFNVVSAQNFRGEDRLAAGGPGLPLGPGVASDPQVTERAMTLTSPNWLRSAQNALPLGYRLVLEESNATAASVTWSAPVAGNPTQGQVTITPKRGALASARITATNQLGSFTLNKTVSGSAAASVSPNVKFQVEYALNGGAAQMAWVSKGTPFVLGNVPLGTTVKLRESNPIVTEPAVVPGVVWGTPVWSTVPGVSGPDADGWSSFTISAATRNLTLGLNNVANTITGGFSILKARAAGEPLPNQSFSFEYKIGSGGTPVSLGPIRAGQSASTPTTIIGGSTVFVREIAPVNLSNVEWADPVWSDLPVGAIGPDANGWYSFTFNPQPSVPLVLTATNKATELFGAFSVTKTVKTTGNPDIAGKSFSLEYRTAPAPVGGAQPVFGAPAAFALLADETWSSSGALPFGTVVEVREVQPTDTPGTSWGTPSWKVNGVSASVVNGWTRFAINSTATASFTVENPAEERYGSFTLRKAFSVAGLQQVIGQVYPVQVQIDTDPVQDINLAGNGAIWQGPSGLAIGTTVKVREMTPPVINGIDWAGNPIWNVVGADVMAPDGDWTVFKITSSTEAAALTVTNSPTEKFGQFQVKKTLRTSGNPSVPNDYTVEYTLDGVAQPPLVLAAGQFSSVIGDLPFGTVVTVREKAPAAVPGVQWAAAWTIDGHAANPDSDGWVTFTIADTTLVAFEVTNSATQQYGRFQVAKTVTGDGALRVPDDTPFVFEYTLNGGEPQRVTATPATKSEFIGGLPFGTVVTIDEVAFPTIPGIGFNPNPGWKLNGADVATPVTFTIDGTALVELSVDNTAKQLKGSFELTKAITGAAADRIPDDASFTVEYSVDNGTTWSALDTITKTHLTVSSDDILVGTTVLVREVAPPDGATFEWGAPEFIVDGASQGTSARFTIASEGPAVAVQLNNPALPLNGTFEVTKRATGFALSDPELAGLTFTALWSGGGRTGSIALNAANGWKNGPGGALFPKGTQITLTEAAVTGLPANVRFDEYNWLTGVPGVTVSPGGKTATLTVATGKPAQLELTNDFTPLKGTFGVKKTVDGDFALTEPELKDLTFTVQYKASNGTSGSLVLNANGGWNADADRTFPTGTTVTLTEMAVNQLSLSPHVKWGGYKWVPNGSYTVSTDGLSASVLVGDGTKPELQLRNTFSHLDGSFAVQKVVAGDFKLTDPELSKLTFGAAYTTSNGQSGTLDLNAKNGWFAAAKKLPAGTEVTVTEVTPTGMVPGVSWNGYRWLPAQGVTISGDGKTATFTVSSDPAPVRLAMENTFRALKSSFSVEKVVTGDFALTSPELADLTFTVPYTASNGVTGSLELNKAGQWAATPGTDFPLGTEITVTEADVSGLPAHVKWNGSEWLKGDGYTVSADGKSASFVLTDQLVQPKLTLQNGFTKLLGGFTLTKKVTGAAASLVPDDLTFTAEFSLDGGQTWTALHSVTKRSPFVTGPSDIPLGTTVLIREVRPAAVAGVAWGAPAFSGTGVTPGAEGTPASFVVGSTATPLKVLLSNPTTPSNGQFQVTKKITGTGTSLLKGDPLFTVKYSYEGQEKPGEFTIKANELASSEPIANGTVVTITEVLPHDGLVTGASWGTPVFVRPDGTVLQNGATITIGTDTVIALQLENPTRPELPSTGSGFVGVGVTLVTLLGAAGLLLLLVERRRRRYGPTRS